MTTPKITVSIMKEMTFAGAHKLPHHEGKCKNLHGHEWKVRVYIQRVDGGIIQEGSSQGMVMDFGDLKQFMKENIEAPLDHSYLNDTFNNPTAETIARAIQERLQSACYLSPNILIKRVEVWETPTSCAIVECP